MPVISSQKVGKCCVLSQFCPKRKLHMQRKSNTIEGISLFGALGKGDIPYYVVNMFYESFGMSCDEVFESLKKNDFFELN